MMMFAATVLLKLRLGPWLFRLYFHELFLYRSRFAALLQGNQIGASTSPESNVQFNTTGRGKKQSQRGHGAGQIPEKMARRENIPFRYSASADEFFARVPSYEKQGACRAQNGHPKSGGS